MKDKRPWNFKINAAELFTIVDNMPKKQHSSFLIQFSKDLLTLNAKTDYGKKIITETLQTIENQRENGKLGGRPTKGRVKAGLSKGKGPPKVEVEVKVKEEIEVEVEIPSFIPLEEWNDFVMMRKQSKKPLSQLAIGKVIKKLKSLSDIYDIGKLLDRSVTNNWLDIYTDDSCKKEPVQPPTRHKGFETQRMEQNLRDGAEWAAGR